MLQRSIIKENIELVAKFWYCALLLMNVNLIGTGKNENSTMGVEHERESSSEGDDNVFDDVFRGSPPTTKTSKAEADLTGPSFGLLFDIDGVIARGSTALQPAKDMIDLIRKDGEIKVPMAFVTNGCNRDCTKAKQLENWLGIEISTDQVIHAQTPLKVFESYKNKYVLCLGQGPLKEICADLGFTRTCSIEDVKESYPLLDMVDHANRRYVAKHYTGDKPLPKIEAIIMFGEPDRWESKLQLLVDLLVTDGNPTKAPDSFPKYHIPILACNMDLVFMAEACMPRFGHGAFLVCLEALYRKITGQELNYTALIGKPSEITYRYAEDCVSKQARQMGYTQPITRLYFFGDNPEVDIVGSNLYDKYITRQRRSSVEMIQKDGILDVKKLRNEIAVSKSRAVPPEAVFTGQSVRKIHGILVETGVYKPGKDKEMKITQRHKNHQGHRDFENVPALRMPSQICTDVCEAVKYALKMERFSLDDY
ncbi:haloacid dehalogenase-like hydrolase domain-containing 5 isoform X2 [Tubulanus polymorphus]|uniref:haloacid dehalogenase-like hydrolase domain-containing 5 isoform X2 n=1 Tax=Tubulanus polymorphus TaxID=672921 RepID=UPI003DA250F2